MFLFIFKTKTYKKQLIYNFYMGSPGRLKVLKRGTKKALLPNLKSPPLVIEGVAPNRIIRLPRFNNRGQLDGAVLIVRQGNKAKVRNVVRKVRTKITKRTRKSAA